SRGYRIGYPHPTGRCTSRRSQLVPGSAICRSIVDYAELRRVSIRDAPLREYTEAFVHRADNADWLPARIGPKTRAKPKKAAAQATAAKCSRNWPCAGSSTATIRLTAAISPAT